MRTNYDRVKIVLDKLDDAGTKAGIKKLDEKVIDRLKELTTEFKRLTIKTRPPIDYSSPVTHIAYAFRSLACHADLIYRTLIGAKKAVQASLSADEIKIACIGGGPGADALGGVSQ